ncbi:HIT family protein [Nocardia yunnanensis]|uniref:HIT family protein n=1 Tax=Nocardia yunnanensis TaxID=2382165 RepID=UPI001CA3D12A|nr:hypothetical protein [Nocardia yunnanensis]
MIYIDDLVVVTHRPLTEGVPRPGYLFVETLRHAPTLADLTDSEAAAVGWALRRAAQALRTELSPAHIFSAITGRTVPHFHQHLFTRPPNTPDSIHWFNGDTWPQAPRITQPALESLCTRLATHFT